MPPRIRPGAAVVAALVLGGCGSERRAEAPPADAPPATAAAAPEILTVTASDYKFDAPDQIRAGMVTVQLMNRGPSPHHVQLLRLGEGKTVADFQAALQKGGMPTWVTPAGGANPPEVGGTSEVRMPLEAGQYVMVCFIPDTAGVPHMAHGMVRPLRVTAATEATASTADTMADVEMTLVDYDFKLSAPLTRGAPRGSGHQRRQAAARAGVRPAGADKSRWTLPAGASTSVAPRRARCMAGSRRSCRAPWPTSWSISRPGTTRSSASFPT